MRKKGKICLKKLCFEYSNRLILSRIYFKTNNHRSEFLFYWMRKCEMIVKIPSIKSNASVGMNKKKTNKSSENRTIHTVS